jgi:hypothetical protein
MQGCPTCSKASACFVVPVGVYLQRGAVFVVHVSTEAIDANRPCQQAGVADPPRAARSQAMRAAHKDQGRQPAAL